MHTFMLFYLLFTCNTLSVCGIGVTIAVTIVKNFAQFQKFQGLVLPWLICSAVCDLIITASLVWYLVSRHPFPPIKLLVLR